MSEETLSFGEYLRALRIERKVGLRMFAERIAMAASNLSNVERGRLNPPQNPRMLRRMCAELDLEPDSAAWHRLHDLAVAHKPAALAPDVAEFAASTPGVPAFLRMMRDRRLTEDELRTLARKIDERNRGEK